MADKTDQIKCVILTMRKENVLLPNANVAEIISVKDIIKEDNRPSWYLGDMPWRNRQVPLVSYEAAGGEDVSGVNLNTQAIVLHTIGKNGDASVPFLGLVMSGVPHVTHFSREQIVVDEDDLDVHPMVACKVRINGARVSVLDIDALIDMVSGVSVDAEAQPGQMSDDSESNPVGF